MAERPVFIPAAPDQGFVKTVSLQIAWHPGFALSQKRKNIAALHGAAAAAGFAPILEISTKSEETLGQHLSAFHLKVRAGDRILPLENAFQGSKVFEGGGPFRDLFNVDARQAKRDPRLRMSGNLVAFDFDGYRFPLDPKTAFYDWLYVTALFEHREWLRERLPKFAGFSDIEFNPDRSINCQARSCALFVALISTGLLDKAVESPVLFAEVTGPSARRQPSPTTTQAQLFTD